MQLTKSVPAVERAFAMMEALDRSRQGMNIADLSRKLAIPRSTAHTIALTLERCGYLSRDASKRNCMLSGKAYLLGRESIRSEDLARAAYTPMKALSASTLLTSHLAALEQTQATYIQKVQGASLMNVDTYVGKRTNLHCTAVGKVLLTYAPEPHRLKVLSRGVFARYTRNTITVQSALQNELKLVSRQGYALDNQEEELGVRCLAVPVFNVRGEFLAGLGIVGTADQLNDRALGNYVSHLQKAAREVAMELSAEASRHAS